jgi:hypothetical protein
MGDYDISKYRIEIIETEKFLEDGKVKFKSTVNVNGYDIFLIIIFPIEMMFKDYIGKVQIINHMNKVLKQEAVVWYVNKLPQIRKEKIDKIKKSIDKI